MLNILVGSVGTPCGMGIVRGLKKSRLKTCIIGMAADPNDAALYLLDESFVNPPDDEGAFIDRTNRMIRRHKVDVVLAGSAAQGELFETQAGRLLKGTSAVLCGEPGRLATAGDDRLNTYLVLRSLGIRCSGTVQGSDPVAIEELAGNLGWPLVVKPRRGEMPTPGVVVGNRRDLEVMVDTYPEAVVQEYVDGDEYLAAAFVNGSGKPVALIVLHRVVDRSSGLCRYELCRSKDLCALTARVALQLGVIGPVALHLCRGAQQVIVVSARARFSPAGGAALAMGYNEAELVLTGLVLKKEVNQPKLTEAVVLQQPAEVVLPGMTFKKLVAGKSKDMKGRTMRLV